MSTVSLSVVSLIAMVPDRECSTPTLIGSGPCALAAVASNSGAQSAAISTETRKRFTAGRNVLGMGRSRWDQCVTCSKTRASDALPAAGSKRILLAKASDWMMNELHQDSARSSPQRPRRFKATPNPTQEHGIALTCSKQTA
jgi:hypothetical protein